MGIGYCRSQCYVNGDACYINSYFKNPSNNDECKFACENESACTGYSIFGSNSFSPNRCEVYGNISADNVANWVNSESWIPAYESTYGFKGFEIYSTSDHPDVRCFKKLENETQDDGR